MYKSSDSQCFSLNRAWTNENFDSNLGRLTLIWKKECLEDEVHEKMLRNLSDYIKWLYHANRNIDDRGRYKKISGLSVTGFCEKGIYQCRHLQLVAQFRKIISQINASEDSDSLRKCKEEIKAYNKEYNSLLYSLQKLPHKQTVCNEMSAAKDKNMNQLNAYLETKKNTLQVGVAVKPSVTRKQKQAGDLQSAGSLLTQAQPFQPALFSAAGPSYSYSNQLTIASEFPSPYPFLQSYAAPTNSTVTSHTMAALKNCLLSRKLNLLFPFTQQFCEQQESLAEPSKMMQDDPEKGFNDAKKILANMIRIFNEFESNLPSTLLNNSHEANEWLARARLVLHVTEDRIHYAYAKALMEKSRLIPSPNKKLVCLNKALDSLQRYDEGSTGCEVAAGLLIKVRFAHYVEHKVPIYNPEEDRRQMTYNLIVIGKIRRMIQDMIEEQLMFFHQGGQHRGFSFVSKESENQGEPTPRPGCSHWR